MCGRWSVHCSVAALLFLLGGPHDAWSLAADSSTWIQLATSGTQPPGCYAHTAIYDSPFNRMIVFGGAVGRNDVRVLSFSGTPQWSLLAPSGTPPVGRIDQTAIHDVGRSRMIVFGGNVGGSYLDDTWELSLSSSTAWSQLQPFGYPPSARSDHVAIFDREHDRMIVFGGLGATGYVNDVWELSFSGAPQWTELTPSGTPPVARGGHCAIWDPVRSRMLVFGGVGGFAYRNDVWALSLSGAPVWTQLVPTGAPPAGRYAATTIYDPIGDRMIVYGGTYRQGPTSIALDDVWALNLTGNPAWTELDPSGILPGGRWNHAAVFDSVRYRMVVFAGENPGIFHDTWTLTWQAPVVGVDDGPIAGARLGPPFPNPSREGVRFDFDLSHAGPIRIEVYDMHGRRVGRVADGLFQAGRHVGAWSGRNERGGRMAPGVYVIRFDGPGMGESRRIVLLR